MMKRVKKLLLVIIGLCVFSMINVKATGILIKGNSVFRKNSSTSTVNFISDSNGSVYYIVNGNPSATEDELIKTCGTATMNETKKIELTGDDINSEGQYIHIMVKDDLNNRSNILTVAIPKYVYYFDDFEAYNEDQFPSFFERKTEGGDRLKQKITKINSNNVFDGYGTYGQGLDERVAIDVILSGYAVLEADISSATIDHSFDYGGLTMGADDSFQRNIIVKINSSNNRFYANNHDSGIVFEANKVYHIKIILDVLNKRYDYYIDGNIVNSEPVEAESYIRLMWFGIYNGSGTVHYDNIKFYTQRTNPKTYSITKGGESNGTFTIDKTLAEKDEIVTITPSASNGYRVKSVKVNNSEDGVTNNDSNYTFEMPETDATVTVEFEKIPFTITADPVTGATISPSGEIGVFYGDDKEITIIANLGYRLKSVKINEEEKISTLVEDKLIITNITEDQEVVVTVEKIPFTITADPVTGATISPSGEIGVFYGDDKEITITANLGYRLTSVKVNDVEKVPLTENKITITNITEDQEVVVTVEKIEYDFTYGEGQKHTIGTNEDAVFKINADKDLFLKAYLNNEELASIFYLVTEGSTIITLKQDFLNNLLPGSYNLRTVFSDGGEANTTFIVEKSSENNPKTGDPIAFSLILGSISIISLFGVALYTKKSYTL